MAFKVIGAGFGRTGTASLKASLETSGFKSCHSRYHLVGYTLSLRRVVWT